MASIVCLPYCFSLIPRWDWLNRGYSSCGQKGLMVDWWKGRAISEEEEDMPTISVHYVSELGWLFVWRTQTCTYQHKIYIHMQTYSDTNTQRYTHPHNCTFINTQGSTHWGVFKQQKEIFRSHLIRTYNVVRKTSMQLLLAQLSKSCCGAQNLVIKRTGAILWPVLSDHYKAINLLRHIYSKSNVLSVTFIFSSQGEMMQRYPLENSLHEGILGDSGTS